jgi:hypothetical protein
VDRGEALDVRVVGEAEPAANLRQRSRHRPHRNDTLTPAGGRDVLLDSRAITRLLLQPTAVPRLLSAPG